MMVAGYIFNSHSLVGATEIAWFPGERIFEPPRAALREPAITFRYFQHSGEEFSEANVAGRLPILGWQKEGISYQLSLEGGVFSTFQLSTEPRELKNSDFRICLPLSFRKGNLSGRFQVYHQSSHLGDNYQDKTGRKSNHFSREKAEFLISKNAGPYRIYAGLGYFWHSTPFIPGWTGQVGWEFTKPIKRDWSFYLSQDLVTRKEFDWDVDLATQAGLEYHDAHHQQRLRIFIEYFSGHSPEGQFYQESEDWLGIGTSFFL